MTSIEIRRSRLIRSRHQSPGYSLVELIVAFTVAIIILLVLFQAFQSKTQLARTQIDVADMQQAQRVIQHEMSRLVRMTGRGGLAHMVDRGNGTRFLPALSVRDNVASGENIVVGDGTTPIVAEGTDVLTIRGVFNSPVYQLNFANPTTLRLLDASGTDVTNTSLATQGILNVTNPSPTGVPQDLDDLCTASENEAMILVSPIDESIYGVVEIDRVDCGPGLATVTFSIAGGDNTAQYRTLYNSGLGGNPILPSGLTNAASAGIVEEFRFYVREPDVNTIPAPALSIAQLVPGAEAEHPNGTASLDLADNILDLQISVGYDSSLGAVLSDRNGDGFTNEDDIVITETANGQDDDWLFNSDQDDPNAAPFIPPWDTDPLSATPTKPEIYYVRLSTLARVHVPDRTYDSFELSRIENRDVDPFNTLEERRFRRQLIQTTIDLRNL
jgi:type II secretory pathway pseudopilin PulG